MSPPRRRSLRSGGRQFIVDVARRGQRAKLGSRGRHREAASIVRWGPSAACWWHLRLGAGRSIRFGDGLSMGPGVGPSSVPTKRGRATIKIQPGWRSRAGPSWKMTLLLERGWPTDGKLEAPWSDSTLCR